METVIFLDTNAVVWSVGAPSEISSTARDTIEKATEIRLSPMVLLELDYLFEVKKLAYSGPEVLAALQRVMPVQLCSRPFSAVVGKARTLTWTRDPFDRLITAQAAFGENMLVTRDASILKHYSNAVW